MRPAKSHMIEETVEKTCSLSKFSLKSTICQFFSSELSFSRHVGDWLPDGEGVTRWRGGYPMARGLPDGEGVTRWPSQAIKEWFLVKKSLIYFQIYKIFIF